MPKIVVLVKFTPDLTGDRSFLADGTVDRVSVPGRLSELDEHAAEQALQVRESSDGWQLTYLTMGPDGAQDALRKALSMGGDAAVHVRDDALHGSDAFATWCSPGWPRPTPGWAWCPPCSPSGWPCPR